MNSTTPTDFDALTPAAGLDESRFAGDDRLFVTFSRKPVMQPGPSREAGRAIYKELDFIRIMVPGDKLSIVERPVDEIDRRRFASKYEKWLATQSNAIEGTPLSSLPSMTQAKVEEYKFFGIHTVEQLAGAADSVGQRFFGFNEDKRRANAFIEVAKGNAPLEKMNEELKKRDADIEELRAQLASLTRQAGKQRKVDPDAEAA